MADSDAVWLVIANCEDELAIWSASRPIPATWRAIARGARQRCEDYVERLDVETRPRVLREYLERDVRRP